MADNKQLLLKKILILWSIIGIQSCIPGRTKSGGESKVIHPSTTSSTTSYSTQRTTTTQTQSTAEAKNKEKIEKLKKHAPPTEEEKNNIITAANKKVEDALTPEQKQTLDENSKATGFPLAEIIELGASIGVNICDEELMKTIKKLSSKKLEPKELAAPQAEFKEVLSNAKALVEEIKKAQAANARGRN
jgi:hypothetical protein